MLKIWLSAIPTGWGNPTDFFLSVSFCHLAPDIRGHEKHTAEWSCLKPRFMDKEPKREVSGGRILSERLLRGKSSPGLEGWVSPTTCSHCYMNLQNLPQKAVLTTIGYIISFHSFFSATLSLLTLLLMERMLKWPWTFACNWVVISAVFLPIEVWGLE